MRADGSASRAGASGEASGEMTENASRDGSASRAGASGEASGEMTEKCVVVMILLATLAAAPARAAGTFASGRHEGRSYALFTPSTPPAGPLVVALHGCWQTPEDFALGTRLNDVAERRGLVVVYPAQSRRDNAYRWQGNADAVVSPLTLSALEAMLARALGASSATTEPAEGAVHAVHRDAGGRPRLETWLVPGMGHAWSGGDARGTHTYPPGPPATERMLDFLLGR